MEQTSRCIRLQKPPQKRLNSQRAQSAGLSRGRCKKVSACGAAPKGAVCVCIGPVTARALAQQTGAPFLTAEDISAEGVAECILRAHRHKKAQEE